MPTPVLVNDWQNVAGGFSAAIAADPIVAFVVVASVIVGMAFYLARRGRRVVR